MKVKYYKTNGDFLTEENINTPFHIGELGSRCIIEGAVYKIFKIIIYNKAIKIIVE